MTTWSRPRLIAGLLGLLIIAPLAAAAAQEIATTQRAWRAAYDDKDWARAIKVGLKLTLLVPDNSTHEYNLACAYALHGDVESAAAWAQKSAYSGFSDLHLITTDPDLNNIRNDPSYKAALKIVARNSSKALELFKQQAAGREPLIIVPTSVDREKPAPVVIVLHGFGGKAERFADVWRKAADKAGVILVAPRAVHEVRGRGYQWGTPEEANVLVLRALDKVSAEHKVDPRRVVLGGFSQGGRMAYTLGLRHADKFCGVIPIAGNYNASYTVARAGGLPRVFVMVGENDRTLKANRAAAKDLEAKGAEVKLNVYPGVGHAFPQNSDEELLEALKFVLRKD